MRKILLLAALAFMACTRDAVFVVDVAADTGLAGQDGNIQRLRATLTNNERQDVLLFPEGGATTISLPTDFSFSVPKELSGEVEVFVEALDANELVIGSGSGSAEIELGELTRFLINLTPP